MLKPLFSHFTMKKKHITISTRFPHWPGHIVTQLPHNYHTMDTQLATHDNTIITWLPHDYHYHTPEQYLLLCYCFLHWENLPMPGTVPADPLDRKTSPPWLCKQHQALSSPFSEIQIYLSNPWVKLLVLRTIKMAIYQKKTMANFSLLWHSAKAI